MSSGCIPNKKDRVDALRLVKDKIKEAHELLADVYDPDAGNSRRIIEEASARLRDMSGRRDDAFIDTSKPLGLSDLLEHYFS